MAEKKNLNQTLTALDGIDAQECRLVMSDYDNFIKKIQHMVYFQTFISQYRNAEKGYMKRNIANEKLSLTHVCSILELNIIKNEDLRHENLRCYKTGAVLTSEIIKKRLRELQKDDWK